MHNDRAVFAVLCFMYCEFSRAVVAELVADSFSQYVGQAIAKYSVGVPIAPDAVAFGFAVMSSLPKAFACHFTAQAVGIETAACAKSRIAIA